MVPTSSVNGSVLTLLWADPTLEYFTTRDAPMKEYSQVLQEQD